MLLESCSMSLSEKWAFSLILIVIETFKGWGGCAEGSVTLTIIAVIIYY